MKDFTKKEMDWILAFEKIVKSMPNTIEVSVNYNGIDIMDHGSIERSFEKVGDGDQINLFAKKHYSIVTSSFHPNGESL